MIIVCNHYNHSNYIFYNYLSPVSKALHSSSDQRDIVSAGGTGNDII